MTATDDLPNLLSIDQLAEHLGTSTRHIRRLVAERRVPYLKVGHFVRFDPTEIATWLDRSRMGTPATLPRRVRPTVSRRPAGLTVGRRDPERGVVSEQRRYADHRPYPQPPRRLAYLTGPTTGVVELPITIDWGPRRSYDLATDADRRTVYERVLQEAANTEQLARYVNGAILVEIWPRLFLPSRVRRGWEERFPELVHPTSDVVDLH